MTAPEAAHAKSVRIPFSLSGDSLEAKLRVFGNRARQPHLGVVILHPLSTLGGSMNDAVVSELWRAAQASKAFGAVLAYNQRGVGSSSGGIVSGTFARLFHKIGDHQEKDATDVFRAIEYLVGVIKDAVGTGKPPRIALIGYSYGSSLAAQACSHPNVESCVAISPPIGKLASFFLPSQTYFKKLLEIKPNDARRRLVVIGSHDQYTTEESLIDFVLLNSLKSGEAQLAVDQHEADDEDALVRRRLALKENGETRLMVEVYARNCHFWGSDMAQMVERCLEFASR